MEAFNLAVEAVALDNPVVGYWMNWMMLISLAAIFFVWRHKPARYALAALFIIFPIALLIFNQTGEVHLIGIAHLLVWGPLAVYMYQICRQGEVNKKSLYGIWFMLFLATIVISMLFDVRDIFLVLTGGR